MIERGPVSLRLPSCSYSTHLKFIQSFESLPTPVLDFNPGLQMQGQAAYQHMQRRLIRLLVISFLIYRICNVLLSNLSLNNHQRMKASMLLSLLKLSVEAMLMLAKLGMGVILLKDWFQLLIWSVSDALDKLMDHGYVFTTIDDSHFNVSLWFFFFFNFYSPDVL